MSKKNLDIVISIVLALLMVGGAVFLTQKKPEPTGPPPSPAARTVNKDELARSNGEDGQPCFVAVDGIVYEIKNSSLWQDGTHVTSGGQAHCGFDLTSVIEKSPHGRTKLEQLEKIGKLE